MEYEMSSVLGRVSKYSINEISGAEADIITHIFGAITLNDTKKLFDEFNSISHLKPEHFTDSKLKIIYGAIYACFAEGRLPDLPIVIDKIKAGAGWNDAIRAELFDLYCWSATGAICCGLKYYADKIFLSWAEVSTEKYARMMTAEFNSREGTKRSEIIEKYREKIFESQKILSQKERENYIAMVARALNAFWEKKEGLLDTGFYDLDDNLSGIGRESFVVIAGRPGMGKTAFANALMLEWSVKKKLPGLFFSIEVPPEEIIKSFYSILAEVDRTEWKKENPTNSLSGEKILKFVEKVETAPLEIVTESNLTNILGTIRQHAESRKIRYVVIDYIGLIRTDLKKKLDAVSAISAELKAIANELKIPIIALSQLNRDCEKTKRKPLLSDLRDSGTLEQDADIVIMLHRDAMYDGKSTGLREEMDALLRKVKYGRQGECRIWFEPRFLKFTNINKLGGIDI